MSFKGTKYDNMRMIMIKVPKTSSIPEKTRKKTSLMGGSLAVNSRKKEKTPCALFPNPSIQYTYTYR